MATEEEQAVLFKAVCHPLQWIEFMMSGRTKRQTWCLGAHLEAIASRVQGALGCYTLHPQAYFALQKTPGNHGHDRH